MSLKRYNYYRLYIQQNIRINYVENMQNFCLLTQNSSFPFNCYSNSFRSWIIFERQNYFSCSYNSVFLVSKQKLCVQHCTYLNGALVLSLLFSMWLQMQSLTCLAIHFGKILSNKFSCKRPRKLFNTKPSCI